MSFVPGDPTFEEHAMMPQYNQLYIEEPSKLKLPHQGWQAPATWTIWPHLDYEDLSQTMPKALHRFEKMSDLQKSRVNLEMENYIPETEHGRKIMRALGKEVTRREREAEIRVEEERIEKKIVEESKMRWRERKGQEIAEEQRQWTLWWEAWRLEREREKEDVTVQKWQLTEEVKLAPPEYTQLHTMAETGAGDVVRYDKKFLESMGLTQQQYEVLEKKLEFDRLTLQEKKDAKFKEYDAFLETQAMRRNFGMSMNYIYHDEITLWKKPFIYSFPVTRFNNPRHFTKSHWNFTKKKLPTTSPIMNEWGDMAWRFVHGLNFSSKYQEMKFRNFLQWINGHISEEMEPVPRELFVFSQMIYCAQIIPRHYFQKVVNLFGSRGYFEKPIYNRRFEVMSPSEKEEQELCPVNGSPFIEISNYLGGLPNCRKTAWYFKWHFYKLKNVYLWCFDRSVNRLYTKILYPGHKTFVCKGTEVVEYLHDDWDGYLRPNYKCPQRVLLFKNRNEDYPLEFYHQIIHRLAAEKNWIIGIVHWEAGRYAFNYIHYAYLTRHMLSAIAFFALYIGRYRPQYNILFTGATIVQILGALFYRLYFDSDHLIDYDYFPNVFHYHYSPIQDDPEQYFTQFFENKSNSTRKTLERGFYRFMTAVTMLHAFYRFCWPDAAYCSLPCDMIPSHPFPYHPEGRGEGLYSFKDSVLKFPPPKYSAKDVALARQPFINPLETSIAVTGGILVAGVSFGAIVYFLSKS